MVNLSGKRPKTLTKTSKTTVVIKEHKPSEYVRRFFKEEWDETKHTLFWK